MKLLALDLGEKWVGSALSDGLGISCKPHKTIRYTKPYHITQFLVETIKNEAVELVIFGNPVTAQGQESEQTKKNRALAELLTAEVTKILGASIIWKFWDERLSSKRAQVLQQGKIKTQEVKMREHSLAAAFILQSYLDHCAFNRSLEHDEVE